MLFLFDPPPNFFHTATVNATPKNRSFAYRLFINRSVFACRNPLHPSSLSLHKKYMHTSMFHICPPTFHELMMFHLHELSISRIISKQTFNTILINNCCTYIMYCTVTTTATSCSSVTLNITTGYILLFACSTIF